MGSLECASSPKLHAGSVIPGGRALRTMQPEKGDLEQSWQGRAGQGRAGQGRAGLGPGEALRVQEAQM